MVHFLQTIIACKVLATHDTFLLLTELDQSLKKLQQERNELGGETLTTRTMNSFQIF